MTDRLTATRRSALMKSVPTRNTSPELLVRALLWRSGYRYRLHRRGLPGTPDIVFPGKRKVIFVNGCFWHNHEGCRKGNPPKSRLSYWKPKLDANKLRDEKNVRALESSGWKVLVIWQCETKDKAALFATIDNFLRGSSRQA